MTHIIVGKDQPKPHINFWLESDEKGRVWLIGRHSLDTTEQRILSVDEHDVNLRRIYQNHLCGYLGIYLGETVSPQVSIQPVQSLSSPVTIDITAIRDAPQPLPSSPKPPVRQTVAGKDRSIVSMIRTLQENFGDVSNVETVWRRDEEAIITFDGDDAKYRVTLERVDTPFVAPR